MSRIYYFIYIKIHSNIFNNRLKFLIPDPYSYHTKDNLTVGLYGYTKDKSIAKEFIRNRNKNLFSLVKKDLSKKEEEYILDKKSDLAIGYHQFLSQIDDKQEYVDVLSTVNEYNTVEYNADEYLFEFGPSNSMYIDYRIFNDEIIDALSTVGYVSDYILHHGTEDEIDAMMYNKSFSLDINGAYKLPQITDKLGVLLYLFYTLFDKESVGELYA